LPVGVPIWISNGILTADLAVCAAVFDKTFAVIWHLLLSADGGVFCGN